MFSKCVPLIYKSVFLHLCCEPMIFAYSLVLHRGVVASSEKPPTHRRAVRCHPMWACSIIIQLDHLRRVQLCQLSLPTTSTSMQQTNTNFVVRKTIIILPMCRGVVWQTAEAKLVSHRRRRSIRRHRVWVCISSSIFEWYAFVAHQVPTTVQVWKKH